MEKEERRKLDKKIKLYRSLGAEKFQKVVFGVEKLKFKIIKKLFPNFIKYFDKYINWKRNKKLKKAKTEKERKEIIRKYQFSKMAMRKELNQEKNRNYHIDPNRPTEIYRYLEWNKQVHKNGIIKNSILIPIFIAGIILGFTPAIPLLVLELLSTAINFECINIQNYNMCRFKKSEKALVKKEEKQIESNIETYGEAAEVIHKSLEETEDLPTFDEIINNITDIEQLRQMRELIKKVQEERKKQANVESSNKPKV